jgi:hypothetical protein
MNRTLVLAALFTLAGVPGRALAQSAAEPLETIPSGFIAAPELKFSEMDGDSAYLLGGRAGWLSDRKLFLGAGAYWLTSGAPGADLAYGGGLVEWFARRSNQFNLSFGGLVGFGTGTLAVDAGEFPGPGPVFGNHRGRGSRFSRRFPSTFRVDEGFFVAEPQANASYTFTDWLRLNFGAGYRLIGAASGLESRLRGPTASISLQLGKFY